MAYITPVAVSTLPGVYYGVGTPDPASGVPAGSLYTDTVANKIYWKNTGAGWTPMTVGSNPVGVRETMPRALATVNQGIWNVTAVALVPVTLYAGDVVTNLSFFNGTTAAVMGTNNDGHSWFALYNNSFQRLAQTADQGATGWAANTLKTLPLASGPYTIATTGTYWIALCFNTGTGGTPIAPGPVGTNQKAQMVQMAGFPSLGIGNSASDGGGGAVAPATLTPTTSMYFYWAAAT